MKLPRWANIALCLLCIAGFAAWVWKWNNDLEPTFINGLLTVGSAIGILLFATEAGNK
jgi:hypothetical protein